jgi:hypothetical protein
MVRGPALPGKPANQMSRPPGRPVRISAGRAAPTAEHHEIDRPAGASPDDSLDVVDYRRPTSAASLARSGSRELDDRIELTAGRIDVLGGRGNRSRFAFRCGVAQQGVDLIVEQLIARLERPGGRA